MKDHEELSSLEIQPNLVRIVAGDREEVNPEAKYAADFVLSHPEKNWFLITLPRDFENVNKHWLIAAEDMVDAVRDVVDFFPQREVYAGTWGINETIYLHADVVRLYAEDGLVKKDRTNAETYFLQMQLKVSSRFGPVSGITYSEQDAETA